MSDPIPRSASRSRDADPPHRTWTVVLASLGVFMTALDTLVVTTSLPVLRVSLHAGLGDLEWTVNAYNLCFACLLLMGAALGDRFGRRRMFTVGLGVFTAASAAAALSPSIAVLIAARAVQGAGAAIVTPLTLTLISEAFPVAKRGMAIGLWGGITGLAVAAGPVVGGAIVGGISWHWIFWLNVPIGIVLMPLAARRLTESFGRPARLDLRGLILAAAGALALTWGLVRANGLGWGNAQIVASLIAGLVLFGAFLGWESCAPSPMLPLSLFRRRAFASANAVSFLMYAALFGTLFLMAQFLQNGLGFSPLGAGLRMLPWTATPMIVAPIAGALTERFGGRRFMVLGLSMQAAGLAWVAAIASPRVGYGQLGIAMTIAGVGISMCFPSVANTVMGSVSPADAGVASGTNSMLRELGGVFGIAVLASIFARHGVYHSPRTLSSGFSHAVWVGAGFSALGALAALLAPAHRRRGEVTEGAHGALALSPDAA